MKKGFQSLKWLEMEKFLLMMLSGNLRSAFAVYFLVVIVIFDHG